MSLPQTQDSHRLIEARRHELAELIYRNTVQIKALEAERDAAIIEARSAGFTYERIAELIGYSRRGARLVVDRIKARSRTADVA